MKHEDRFWRAETEDLAYRTYRLARELWHIIHVSSSPWEHPGLYSNNAKELKDLHISKTIKIIKAVKAANV